MHLKIIIMSILAINLSTQAVAEENELGYMPIIKTWNGPFDETQIIKYADYAEGVACYVYIPRSISSNTIYSGNTKAIHFDGNIGSISCVKVADTPKKK